MNCDNEREHGARVAEIKESMLADEKISDLCARFKVISVYHIVEAVGGNQSAVSHQLKILKDNKIIKSRRNGQNVLYSVSDWHVLTMIGVAKEHLNCNE